MAENFFARFVAAVAPEQPAMAAGATAEIEATPGTPAAAPPVQGTAPMASLEAQPNADAAPEAKKDIRLPPALWVTGLAAIIGAMLYFFTGRRVTR
jgi:hypothetical protein